MTNAVLQAIADRRSIRAYTSMQVSEKQLATILDAGLAAPSARNTQPWHFTAVQDAALIARVNDAFLAEARRVMPEEARFKEKEYSVFHGAPTVIFLSCPGTDGEMRYAELDTGIAVQTMALAAHSIGLGSVILGFPRFAFLGPEGDALRKALAFPEGYDFMIAIAIGDPAATKDAHPVLEGRVTIIK